MSYPIHLIEYWDKNGITPPTEKVVCAANRLDDGTILCGARHWDVIMRNQSERMTGCTVATVNAEQGFINQWGVFLDRVEALAVVKASGQPFDPKRNGSTDMLFSEGLY